MKYLCQFLCFATLACSCSTSIPPINPVPESAKIYAYDFARRNITNWCGVSLADSMELLYPAQIFYMDPLKYETGRDPLECFEESKLQLKDYIFYVKCTDIVLGKLEIRMTDEGYETNGTGFGELESNWFEVWEKFHSSEGYIIMTSSWEMDWFVIKDRKTVAIYQVGNGRIYDSFNEIDLYMLQKKERAIRWQNRME